MSMLRNWNGESNALLLEALAQFGVTTGKLSLHKYEALTPDSFIWMFSVITDHDSIDYYLYAEDYVPSLDHVTETILRNRTSWNPDVAIELVPVANAPIPVQADSQAATNPAAATQRQKLLGKYAAISDLDYVFLAKVLT